ncbi:MAG TPA: oxidoreductase, partial [Anaeromyxobacteraceae bacterium]
MESVRVDLRRTGVRAITIYPGFVKTEMTAKNRFPMPFLMELDDAVKRMTDGIARGEPAISFPLPARALVRLVSAIPRSLYEPMAGRGGR